MQLTEPFNSTRYEVISSYFVKYTFDNLKSRITKVCDKLSLYPTLKNTFSGFISG